MDETQPGAGQTEASRSGSRLAGESLSIEQLRAADDGHFVPILANANVVKIGAQSLIDRGR